MCTLLELTFQLKSDTSCQCNEIKFRIDILQCYFETSHAKESWDGQTRLGHCKNCFPGSCEVSTTTLSPCCFPLVSVPSCLQSFLALLAERGPCFWCAVGVWYLMPCGGERAPCITWAYRVPPGQFTDLLHGPTCDTWLEVRCSDFKSLNAPEVTLIFVAFGKETGKL